jgi:uncharacterized surface protein with fasciclin (FAS1) repeats
LLLIACGGGQHGSPGSADCADDLADHGYVHRNKGTNSAHEVAERVCAQYTPAQIAQGKALVDAKYGTQLVELMNIVSGLSPAQVECAKKEFDDMHPSVLLISSTCRALAEPAAPAPALVAAGGDDILSDLAAAGNFTKFLKLVDAAHDTDKLKSVGPFTVFAPTDDAFAKLPDGAYDGILTGSPDRLKQVVEFHIVAAKVAKSDLKEPKSKKTTRATTVMTLSGHMMNVTKQYDGSIEADRGKVIKAELPASNGLIYTVDTMLQP